MSFRTRLALFLVVLAAVAVSIPFPHLIPWLMGIYPAPAGTPFTYQLWSGFIPAAAIVGVIWPFVNCTVNGCMRYGRYHVSGFRVCHAHHPDDNITRDGVSHEHVIRLHKKLTR